MRTKNLLTAIVLPSLFAACTADELVKIDNGAAEDLSKRPIVEGVTINLGGAETKAVVPEGGNFNTIQYESTDKVGALLVDQYVHTSDDYPIRNYQLMVNKFNTNYEFKNVGGANFASEAYMVEGNYVFYFPYNGQRNRDQLLTNLPKNQVLAQDANGNWSTLPDVLAKSIENGAPIALGYDFIEQSDADKQSQAVMKQIYAMPEITIVNSYTENETVNGSLVAVAKPIKISEITLSYGAAAQNFTLSAPLKFATAAGNTAWTEAATATNGTSIVKALFNETITSDYADTYKAGVWTEAKVSSSKARYTSDMVGAAVAGGSSTTITLTLAEPVEIAADGRFTFYAVIPAADYSTDKLHVQVTNEVGLSTARLEMGAAKLYQGRRYPIEEYTDGDVNTDLCGSALTAYVDEFTQVEGYRVTSVDEIINYVKTFAPAPDPATPEAPAVKLARYTLKLRVAGEGAVINQRLASFLNQTTTKAEKIEFVNEVSFEGTGINLKPSRLVVFDEGAKVKAGANVTLEGTASTRPVVTNVAATNNIVVKAGKKIQVINGGELTLKSGDVKKVQNYGTLNLVANTNATIENHKVANVTEDVTLSGALTNGNTRFNNEAATLNVSAGKTLTVTATATNAYTATINNQGKIIAANLTNKGTLVNGSDSNVLAEATILENSSVDVQNKVAVIENYAKVLGVRNDASLVMKNVSASAVVTGSGIVNNDKLAIVTNNGSNKVTYTMTGNQTSIPTYLVANSVNTLILKNVALTLSAGGYHTAVTGLNVEVEGTTTIGGSTGAGAKQYVDIDAGKQLTVNGTLNILATAGITSSAIGFDIVNKGTVNNYGVVNYVASYIDATGSAQWNNNPYIYYAAPAGVALANNGFYGLTTTTTIIGVSADATIVAESAVAATMINTVFGAITGSLVVGDNVTLTIGTSADYNVTNRGVADIAVATLNASTTLIADMKAQLNPSVKNVSKIGTGKIVAQFTATLTSGSVSKTLTAEWTGSDWKITAVA